MNGPWSPRVEASPQAWLQPHAGESLTLQPLKGSWIFDFGARIYGWFTAQEIWRASCARLAFYFPTQRPGHRFLVLELGCGPGVTAVELARVRPDALIIGLDIAPGMLQIAREQTTRSRLDGRIPLVLADATALPFAADAVDVVTGHSFLYLVPDRDGVLRESNRVLRPGGAYVSMEPRDGPWTPAALSHILSNLRFAVSVLLWRPYSKMHGRLTDARFRELFLRAGLLPNGSEPVLDGMGIIGHASKP